MELPPDAAPATHVRYRVLLALGLAVICAYLTRILAASNTTVQREFGLSYQGMGDIIAGFALGYFWFQIPGGWLANRLGVRIMLPAIAVLWSLCTIWMSLATTGFELQASRIAVGLAQAGLMPCCAKVLGDWFPDRQRGMASAIMGASMGIGGVLATGLTAALLPVVGWRNVFLLYSYLGLAWSYAFYRWFRNTPADQPSTNEAERRLIKPEMPRAADATPELAAEDGSSARLLVVAMITSSSMWTICSMGFFRAFAHDFFNTWFPAYLEKGRHVKLVESGLLAAMPLIAAGVGNLFGGWLVDWLLRRTGSKWISRSGTATVALTLTASCMLAAAWASDPTLAVAIISCGSFFSGFAGPVNWAVTLDVSGKHIAVVFGIMNLIGNVGSYTCAIAVGHLFDYIELRDADWNLVLYLFVAANLAGAVSAALMNPNRSAVKRGLVES